MTAADRGQEVRGRLLEAAAQLIAERGWTAVSTRTVAERAGVTPGLVHYHFASVQELLSRAAVAALRRTSAQLGPVLAQARSAQELADTLVASLDAFTGADPLSVLFVETYLAATRDPALRADVAQVLTALRADLATRLHELGVADAGDTATVLGAALDGLVLHRALDPAVSADSVRTVLHRLLVRDHDGGQPDHDTKE